MDGATLWQEFRFKVLLPLGMGGAGLHRLAVLWC